MGLRSSNQLLGLSVTRRLEGPERSIPQGGPAIRLDVSKRVCSFLQEGPPPGNGISYRATSELKNNYLSKNLEAGPSLRSRESSFSIDGSLVHRSKQQIRDTRGEALGHTLKDDHNRVNARTGTVTPPQPHARKEQQHSRREGNERKL